MNDVSSWFIPLKDANLSIFYNHYLKKSCCGYHRIWHSVLLKALTHCLLPKKIRPQVFCKKFHRIHKNLRWSPFSVKLQALGSLQWILRSFLEHILHITCFNGCFGHIFHKLSSSKDILIDRIEHAYFFFCLGLIFNGCFLISKPHKYHIWLKRDPVV